MFGDSWRLDGFDGVGSSPMRRTFVIVSVLSCLARSGLARAEEIDAGVACEQWGQERVLGGHVFQYPVLADSAFLASTLALEVLMSFNTTRTVPADNVGTVSVQQVAPLLNIDTTVHVADPVSVYLTVTGGAATGISTSSLVLKGTSLSYALSGGAIVRLIRDEEGATQIALRAGGFYASGTVVNLRSLVEVLQGNSGITIGDIVNGSVGEVLLTPFNSYGAAVSGALAHAFSRWLSLQSSLALRLTSIEANPYNIAAQARQSHSQLILTPAAAFAVTFDASSFHVPVALMLEYRLGLSFNNADSATTTSWGNSFDLGVYYSGRPDLQAGIAFVALFGVPPLGVLGPGSPGATQNGYGSIISLRYVW